MGFESPLARGLRLAGQFLGQGVTQFAQQRQAQQAQERQQFEQSRGQAIQGLQQALNSPFLSDTRRRELEDAIRRLENAGGMEDLQSVMAGRAPSQTTIPGVASQRVPPGQGAPGGNRVALGTPDIQVSDLGERPIAGLVGQATGEQAAAERAYEANQATYNRLVEMFEPDMTAERRERLLDSMLPALDLRFIEPSQMRFLQTLAGDVDAEAVRERQLQLQRLEHQVTREGLGVDADELALQRAREELDAFRKRRPLEYQRLQGQVGDESAARVVNAFNSGVIQGLNEDERAALAGVAGTDNLDEWAETRAGEVRRLQELEVETAERRAELLDQNLRVGELDFDLKELALDRNRWQFQRDQFTAGVQDEEQVAQGIASSVANGDTELLAFYHAAYRDPTSDLGQQLRSFLGDDYDSEFDRLYQEASELRGLERREVEANVNLRESQAETARIKLRQARTLTPLETEALRAQYATDRERALLDLRSLEFTEVADTIASASSVAEAVTPEFWDELPDRMQTRFQELGIDPTMFRVISAHEEWLRGSDRRRQGMDMLKFLVESPPESEAARAAMLEGVSEAVDLMEFDSPEARAAFMASATSIWAEADENLRLRALQIAQQSADAMGGMDPVDIARVASAWSSYGTSLRHQAERVMPQKIMNSGCATPLDIPVIDAVYINPDSWETTPECGALKSEYDDVLRGVQHANAQEEYWAKQLGFAPTDRPAVPQGSMDITPPSSTPADEPLFTNGGTQQMPVTKQDDGGNTYHSLRVNGVEVPSSFTVRAFRLSSRDTVEALLEEIEEQYGLEASRAFVQFIRRERPNWGRQ